MRPDGFANWSEPERAAWYDSHQDEVESWLEERGETMDATTEAQALTTQIERLAEVIMNEVPGEPSQGQGAIDCAIRLIRCAYTTPETFDPGEPMETVTLTYDAEKAQAEAKAIEMEKAAHRTIQALVEENRKLRALLHSVIVLAKDGQEGLM